MPTTTQQLTLRYDSLREIRQANREAGLHFFDNDTMQFFNSRILSGLYGGRYFVTAERMRGTDPFRHTIREALPDGSIATVGEHNAYPTRGEAIGRAQQLAAGPHPADLDDPARRLLIRLAKGSDTGCTQAQLAAVVGNEWRLLADDLREAGYGWWHYHRAGTSRYVLRSDQRDAVIRHARHEGQA